jgi:hypothetical protein
MLYVDWLIITSNADIVVFVWVFMHGAPGVATSLSGWSDNTCSNPNLCHCVPGMPYHVMHALIIRSDVKTSQLVSTSSR